MKMDRHPVLMDVIRRFGTASALAAYLQITDQAVSRWTRIPVRHALAISRHTGIPCHILRPDIYEKT